MLRKLLVTGLVAGGMTAMAAEGLATSAPGAAPGVREGISVELGHRDFRNYCAACHGVEGTGDGTLAEFLTLRIPDLTKLSKMNAGQFPRQKVVDMIDGRVDVKIHGPRDMPVWGDWFDKEAVAAGETAQARSDIVSERIESLVSFIKSIQVK